MDAFLTLDGGGTKTKGFIFNQFMDVSASGESGGVNTTQHSLSEAEAHLKECIDKMRKGKTLVVDTVFATLVGRREWLERALKAIPELSFKRLVMFDEARSALLAGACRQEGVVVISGTGSNAHLVTRENIRSIGGWGPYVGDQGSGYWIGREALAAVVLAWEGVGEATILTEFVGQAWGLKANWDLVRLLAADKAPFVRIASFTPVVSKAAKMGDAVALRILREAGRQLAIQANGIIRQVQEPQEKEIVLCGGAWKAHRCMRESFISNLTDENGVWTVRLPLFEHVAAGAAHFLLGQGMSRDNAREMLIKKLPEYQINWFENKE